MTLKRVYQQRFRKFMINNSSLERRRFWVTVMHSGLGGWTILSLAIGLTFLRNIPLWTAYAGTFSFITMGAVGFVFTLFTSTYVSHGLQASTELLNRALDERQRSVWDRAIRKTYLVVLFIFLVATVYWSFVQPLMGLLPLAIFLLVLSLPNAIVACTEPDAEE